MISAAAVRTETIVPEKTDVEIIPVMAGMTASAGASPMIKGENAANTAIRHPADPQEPAVQAVPPAVTAGKLRAVKKTGASANQP